VTSPTAQPPNRQGGVDLTPGHDPAADEVATGDRMDEVRYQRDADQVVRVVHTDKPDGPLPPQEQSKASEEGAMGSNAPPVQDVATPPDGPSVWDARPTED